MFIVTFARKILPTLCNFFRISPLCPLWLTISSHPPAGPINMSHPDPSGSNFCSSQNVISWGENGVCVWETRSAAGSVQDRVFFFLRSASHVFPPPNCLLLFGIDPSALRPLKEFSDSCLQLFSLPGYDSNSPQAAHKGSKIYLSLSTHLLVTADGWC